MFSAAVIAALLYFDMFMFNRRITYIMIGYVLLMLLVSLVSTRVKVSSAAQNFTDDPLNATIFTEHEILFKDDGVTIRNEMHIVHSKWQAFVKKEENKLHYYLFKNSIDALIIPKRYLRSAEDKIAFEKLLTAHLSLDAEIGALTRK